MNTPAADPIQEQSDVDLRHTHALNSVGSIEVMRLTRLVKRESDGLHFKGEPASSRGHLRKLKVTFVAGDAPSPGFDEASGSLHVFYSEHERKKVEAVLLSKRQRYCYFWHSRNGVQRHAWLLSSP